MIAAIINRLKAAQLNNKPIFARVDEAIDLSSAMKGILKPSPVAFVVELSRRPGGNSREMGPALQLVTTTVGIVIGIGKINDPLGTKTKTAVTPILAETRKALFGFSPSEQYEPLLLSAADTIGVTDHALWQLERFTTEHFEESNNG